MANEILKRTKNQRSMFHYWDGVVDMRLIYPTTKKGDCFTDPLYVFVNCDGHAETLDAGSNFFSPCDLVNAYERAYDGQDCDYDDDERRDYVEAFKKYLIRTGCPEEELDDFREDMARDRLNELSEAISRDQTPENIEACNEAADRLCAFVRGYARGERLERFLAVLATYKAFEDLEQATLKAIE